MPLRLETWFVEDRDNLKEIQAALKRSDALPILERCTDRTLIRLLRHLRSLSKVHACAFLVLLAVIVFISVGMLSRQLGLIPGVIGILFAAILVGSFDTKPDIYQAVKPRLKQATLPTLLDAYALKINTLGETLEQAISKRLAVVTTDDLEVLSLSQRKQLLRFTLLQVSPDYHHSKPYTLSENKSQAATVGFLALASLKQPGAEQITPQTVSKTHVNLRRAIEEYHAAMKVR